MKHPIKITEPVSPKLLRQLRGMSQAQLGVACGRTQEDMSRIETGAREPSISLARRISEVLEVDLKLIRFPAEGRTAT